ncbi:hypothetical protein RDWZM_002753 [Blomia tropicalis]|uniref:PPPDE domain-containing protein n=1 Tax=Blomia tropicalis TaxID=40697 RepID=A0A9Q0MDD3_BLOTA|nr:hypothetical protein RDWZM_002753 [Blomia tropicalis]
MISNGKDGTKNIDKSINDEMFAKNPNVSFGINVKVIGKDSLHLPPALSTNSTNVSNDNDPKWSNNNESIFDYFNVFNYFNNQSNTKSSPLETIIPPNMVKVNVYGLTYLNRLLEIAQCGIYHSGVEVYGIEWAYGGFELPVSSIYRMDKPRDLVSLSIENKFHFIETIVMGPTNFTRTEIESILIDMGKSEWIGTNYHLLNQNCNSFTDTLCKILCGRSIPTWINRLATTLAKFPYLVQMLPEEYFTPFALRRQMTTTEPTLKSSTIEETVGKIGLNQNFKSNDINNLKTELSQSKTPRFCYCLSSSPSSSPSSSVSSPISSKSILKSIPSNQKLSKTIIVNQQPNLNQKIFEPNKSNGIEPIILSIDERATNITNIDSIESTKSDSTKVALDNINKSDQINDSSSTISSSMSQLINVKSENKDDDGRL